ncbi:MAG: hypothetical protein ABJO27_04785 [Pseudoruegeria sp.]
MDALRLFIGAFCFSFPTTLAAQDILNLDGYKFYDPSVTILDESCKSIAVANLGKQAEGLQTVGFGMPANWDSLFEGVHFFSYGNVSFKSTAGDVTGSMLCAVIPAKNTIVEMAFNFDGRGLAGFRSITSKPRNESYRTSHIIQTPTQSSGTE